MVTLASQVLIESKFKWNQSQKNVWLEEREKALDYYHGETDKYTNVYFADDLQIPRGNINITKRIIDRTSLVYMVPPKRMINGEQNDDYNKITHAKDHKFQRWERMINLLDLVPLRVVWRIDHFEYDLIFSFEPIFSTDPMNPVAIQYPIQSFDDQKESRDEVWAYVDAQQSFLFSKATGNRVIMEGDDPEDTSHNYGLMPIIWGFKDGVPERGFLHTGVANDLIRVNEGINVAKTNGWANIQFQSFGHEWISGSDIPQDLKISQNEAALLGDDGQMGIVSPPNTIDSVSQSIIDDSKLIGHTYHLSDAFVEGTTAESGVALRLRNQELIDDRKSDVTRWRMYEDRIYRIEQAIAKAEAGKNFSDDFAVDYEESIEVLSPQEQREKWDWEVSNGYKDKADILMEQNPDKFTTREEAQTYLAERSSLPAETDLFGSFVDNA